MADFEAILKKQSLWVWVAEDPPGEVGVLAGGIPPLGMATLSGNTRKRAERHRPLAEKIARASGKTVRLVRFQFAEELDRIPGSS